MVPYREAFGFLVYLAVETSSDISLTLGQVSQFCKITEKIIGRQWSGVCPICVGPLIVGFIWFLEQKDFKATQNPTSFPPAWRTCWLKKPHQSCVYLFTTESEYVAAREGIWLQRLLVYIKLGYKKMLLIRCNNQSYIQLIKNPVFHKRTTHIDVRQIMCQPTISVRIHLVRHFYKSSVLNSVGKVPVSTDLN